MMTMMFSCKILVYYLVVVVATVLGGAGLNSVAAAVAPYGISNGYRQFSSTGMSNDCLKRICLADTSPCYSNYVGSEAKNVADQDVEVVGSLLERQPQLDTRFLCSSEDVRRYSRLIRCSCTPTNNGTCRVTYIDFSNMDLRGSLPDCIGNLTFLTSLDLSGNKLSGLIPKSVTNLKELRFLDLCYNSFEGPIPSFNSENQKLESLYLCSNRFNGTIPKGLGQLPSLRYLFLRLNRLNGTTEELWNIKGLQQLELQDNPFNGQIPEQLGSLNQLEQLRIMNNDFSGKLPKSIGALKSLQTLQIQGTNLNGTIPDLLYELPKLELLWLVGNNFDGPLPKTFSSKTLASLHITDIVGDGNGYKFPEIPTESKLEALTLRNCSLVGPIPQQLWQLQSLAYLDLSFNRLSGNIPPTLDHSFSDIYLRGNQLSGLLPEWTYNTSSYWNASYVDVSDNRFIHNLPSSNLTIANEKNIFACCSNSTDEKNKWLHNNYRCVNETSTNDRLYINCGGNETYIDGNYYEADMEPYGTSTFVLSNNSAWGYSSMGGFAYAARNKYILTEKCNVSNLAGAPLYTGARVAPFSLKYYGFCLRNDNYTVKLDFAEIGWDPSRDNNDIWGKRLFNVEIQKKKELENFNIAEEAGGVYKNRTREFNVTVSDNRMEIHLYWSGKGSMIVPSYFGPLVSAISISAVPKHHPKKLSSVSIGLITGSSFIFLGLIIALCWMFGLLAKKQNKNGVELYPGGIFTYPQIKTATNSFHSDNKIGETGSVYKGLLADGMEVAVKQLSVDSKQETHQIIKEIGLIYTLQHPNIAKPMGCCVKERQVLLVYHYMENLSLQHALLGSDDEVRSKLNWKTRLKICLGMAKGLAFLHEESKLDIIHSNIKPTNILLDKEFNVKISDFRYSEIHDDQSIQQQETTTDSKKKPETKFRNVPRAKDTGHMAPEYMQGLPLTPKADVYSFGLVTLEILSGLPYIINKPREDILLISKAYTYNETGILESLLDPSLKEHKDYKQSEAVMILYLAMRCVNPSDEVRPPMSEVVQYLEGKKKFRGKRITPSPMPDPLVSPTSQSAGESGSIPQEGSSTSNVSDSVLHGGTTEDDSGISPD